VARGLLHPPLQPAKTKDPTMPSSITSVDLRALEVVTGGAATSHCSTSNNLLQTLTTLSSTLKDIGGASRSSGFSTTEILMLGLLMNQNRGPINVFVRRPYW
jgi:hypothetical protein